MYLARNIVLSRPIVGCSIGCDFCYAEKANIREGWTDDFKKCVLMDDYEEQLTKYNNAVYMVTGYSDPSDWNDSDSLKILKIIEDNPQNQYLILTKRPYDLRISSDANNLWVGVSVCKKQDKSRIDSLLKLKFRHKFVAFEPLLEDLGYLDLSGIDWCSIGREIGDKEDKVTPEREWIENIVTQAQGKHILMKESLEEIVPDLYTQSLPEPLMVNISEDLVSDAYLNVIKNT